MYTNRHLFRGLSELNAIAVLLGLSIAFSMAFFVYINSEYASGQTNAQIYRVVENEKMNTLIKLASASGDSVTLLLKKFGGTNTISFFIYNGTAYDDCSKIVKSLVGGAITYVNTYNVDDILVVPSDGRGNPYSFRYYARSMGYPDSGKITVCTVGLSGNTVAVLTGGGLKPQYQGYSYTEFYSNGRKWRMFGTIEFTVAYLGNPNGNHLAYNGTWIQLRVGDRVRIDVDTQTGKIDMTPQTLPNGKFGAWILSLNVFAKAVYLNGALIAQNVLVEMVKSEVAIDLGSLFSSISIEIYPSPPGFTRIRYGGETILDDWNNSKYVRIFGWIPLVSNDYRQMVLQLDSGNLYAQGFAYAIYISDKPSYGVDRLSLFVVTYINNRPYLVDVYDYRLS
ncbi:MAG: hypothetical protein QW284_07560 [Ignisphaera sp.]